MKRTLLVALLFGAMLMAACGGGGAEEAQPNPTAASSGAAAQAIKVDLTEWEIEPKDLTVKAGTVRFEISNPGDYKHSLALEGQGIEEESKTISGGENTTLEVDLKPGKYKTWCPVGNHESQGMVGTLIVE